MKKNYLWKTVAFHLGEVKRAFQCGMLDENKVVNMDETHFIFDFRRNETLRLRGNLKNITEFERL